MTDKVQKIREFLVGIADADGVSTILASAIEKKILPYIDSLQEEPVNEELEEAAKLVMTKEELINKIRNNRSFDLRASKFYEPWDISDETIKDMADDFYYLLKDVLNYLVGKEESVSEGLEEAANNAVIALVPSFGQKYSDGSYVSSYRDCFKREELLELFKAGANWQKQQILDCNITLQRTFELGKQEMKQQMMAKAIEATVHIDAGNYPYIPQMELYDYDNDVPLAKEGDKYKVVLIKED